MNWLHFRKGFALLIAITNLSGCTSPLFANRSEESFQKASEQYRWNDDGVYGGISVNAPIPKDFKIVPSLSSKLNRTFRKRKFNQFDVAEIETAIRPDQPDEIIQITLTKKFSTFSEATEFVNLAVEKLSNKFNSKPQTTFDLSESDPEHFYSAWKFKTSNEWEKESSGNSFSERPFCISENLSRASVTRWRENNVRSVAIHYQTISYPFVHTQLKDKKLDDLNL